MPRSLLEVFEPTDLHPEGGDAYWEFPHHEEYHFSALTRWLQERQIPYELHANGDADNLPFVEYHDGTTTRHFSTDFEGEVLLRFDIPDLEAARAFAKNFELPPFRWC